jgi:hypothetical protein
MGKYPWWVEEKEKCMWCYKFMNLFVATVNEKEDGVEMTYLCENSKCSHLTHFSTPNKMVFVQQGKKAVEVFVKKMAEPDSSGSSVPPETIEA